MGGIVGDGIELVEDGFTGGNEMGVFAPRCVFDDLVERRAEGAAAAGRAA